MSPALARSTYIRPKLNLGNANDGAVNSLPDLVEFNAANNPHHIFGVQNANGQDVSPCEITFFQLQAAVEYASSWLIQTGCTKGRTRRQEVVPPVGIMLGSDISIFIYMAALLRIGTPVSLFMHSEFPVDYSDKLGSTPLCTLDACCDRPTPHRNLPFMCFDQHTYVVAVKRSRFSPSSGTQQFTYPRSRKRSRLRRASPRRSRHVKVRCSFKIYCLRTR